MINLITYLFIIIANNVIGLLPNNLIACSIHTDFKTIENYKTKFNFDLFAILMEDTKDADGDEIVLSKSIVFKFPFKNSGSLICSRSPQSLKGPAKYLVKILPPLIIDLPPPIN